LISYPKFDGLERGQGGVRRGKIGGLKYEGLPPEVGAFKFENGGHAPWPVHILGQKRQIYAIFGIRGVGVIPVVWQGSNGMEGGGRWDKRW